MSYSHLTINERCCIYQFKNSGLSIGNIAKAEFSGYEKIKNELNCNTYFCDPYSAWQKVTNENTNGLRREIFPKEMELSEVDEDELSYHLTIMKDRPRKCLQ
ncbi:MAG: hypothetical protein HFF02_02810 [Erysipelotrichaceae bacterium]|nr:hypothetical protein [Erysipelotrichaceae bacterium]